MAIILNPNIINGIYGGNYLGNTKLQIDCP